MLKLVCHESGRGRGRKRGVTATNSGGDIAGVDAAVTSAGALRLAPRHGREQRRYNQFGRNNDEDGRFQRNRWQRGWHD